MISIVIPSNNGKMLDKCIDSLVANTKIPYEIIVIDNGNEDSKYIHDTKLKIKFVKPLKKVFAHWCNLGISQSKSDLVVLLNNDAFVIPGTLENMLISMEQNKDFGIMACTTNKVGQLNQFFPDPLCCKPAVITSPDVCFVCVMIRRDLWNKVKMDENYIMSVEDIDYCWEAWRHNYKVGVCLASFIWHVGSSSQSTDADREWYKTCNKDGWIYFANKYGDKGKERARESLGDLVDEIN